MITKLRWQLIIVAVTILIVVGLLLIPDASQVGYSPKPSDGGVYSEALVGGFSRLNPLLDSNNPADRDVDRLIFSGLVSYDAAGLPTPELADSWGVSQDGKTYNFSIRQNAVWHDNTPVTVDDVIYTIGLISEDASLYPASVKDLWKKVEIKKLNDKTVQFVLPEPFAPFLDYLTFGILPVHLLAGTNAEALASAPFNLSPVGTGPYKFDKLIIENGKIAGVQLAANDLFYKHRPFIDQVIFKYYADSESAYAAYSGGQVLGISQIPPSVISKALSDPGLNMYSARLPELSIILFNLNAPEVAFFQDAQVRAALYQGVNRKYIVEKLMAGQAIQADSPIFPGTWAYNDQIKPVSYDPQKALTLLKKAGYILAAQSETVRQDKDGKKLAFTLVHPDDELHAKIADSIKQDWAVLGVDVTLKPMPYDQLKNTALGTRDFQAALVDINLMKTPDPDPYPFWHESEATGGQNYSQWTNRAASEFLEQARINPDYTERARLYKNFQVIFANEKPAIPLYYPVYTFGINASLQNAQIPPLFDTSDRFLTISDWFLVTRRSLNKAQ